MIDVNEQKAQLSEYVLNLQVREDVKRAILDSNFIDRNPEVYLYYPKLFKNCFDHVDKKNIDLLCIAGFLYYLSIMHSDYLYDEFINSGSKEIFFLVEVIEVCQQESIKILTHIFGLDSEFWRIWNNRKIELMSALKTSSKGQACLSNEEYEELSDFKSSFGKVAIDSLNIMSNAIDDSIKHRLMMSHKYFYCGFQIIDDIVDFKKDLKNSQYNFAVQTLHKRLNEDGLDWHSLSPDVLYKYLFVKDIHSNLIDQALTNLITAEAFVRDYDLPEWKKMIKVKVRDAKRLLFEINNRIKITENKLTLSHAKLKNQTSIDLSIEMGKSYIRRRQNNEGSWEDYINQGGISNIWTTGFVLYHISDSYLNFDADLKKRAVDFLLRNKISDIWGYNSTWIEDSDSTNFVLLSLLSNGVDIASEIHNLVTFQTPNGGISTYADPEQLISELDDPRLNNVAGWTMAHTCVSAVSLLLLLKATYNKESVTSNLITFLKSQHNDNYLWNSYWWTSPIYTTSIIIECDNLLEDTQKFINIESSINEILKTQNDDGSFGDGFTNQSVFYTALVVKSICSKDKFTKYKNHIDRAIEFLLHNQYDDGSWEGSNALRIPHPDTKQVELEWPIKEFGVGVRAPEFNRLFSTSLALHALGKYSLIKSSINESRS